MKNLNSLLIALLLFSGTMLKAQLGVPTPKAIPGVGIGTTTPKTMLDVEGDARIRVADTDNPSTLFNGIYRNPDGKLATSVVPDKSFNFDLLVPEATNIGTPMWANHPDPMISNMDVLVQEHNFTVTSGLAYLVVEVTEPQATCYIPGVADLRNTGNCKLKSPSGSTYQTIGYSVKYKVVLTAPNSSVYEFGSSTGMTTQTIPPANYVVMGGRTGNIFLKKLLTSPVAGTYNLKIFSYKRGLVNTKIDSQTEYVVEPATVSINTYKLL